MAKKKIEIKREYLQNILIDKLDVSYSYEDKHRNHEEDVDFKVKNALKHIWGENVVGKKTGNKDIDALIPAYHGDTSNGKPDVMLYNVFGKDEISLIIENKKFTSTEDPILQAITYAGVGSKLSMPCRIIIGNVPSKILDVRVLVKNKYEHLFINGKKVDYFFGEHIFKLIYDNPNINEFVLEELLEKPFTQKEFHSIINKLKTLYRQIPEIQNNDDLSINFTVAMIALKMIMEKQNIAWDIIKEPKDILSQVDNIAGRRAIKELKDKYGDIFIITDKDKNETFNFYNLVDTIDVRENGERTKPSDSILMIVYTYLKEIPEKDSSIDLFGEVYECLASKKTKSLLGEYFTRRHIIQAIVRMFLTEDDIESIVQYKKTIGDPACGTGGFLTESFKYIKDYCEKNMPRTNISNLASQIIIGYDINNNSIGRTRINMTLAGDGFSDIQKVNTLLSSEIKSDIDYILTNVPYGKGDFAISDPNCLDAFLKSNNNKRLELNFVIKVIQMLKKGGKASIIVPEGLLEAPTLAPFREYLLKQCRITTIISLPKFAFAPYTKWKTYVIFIEKRNVALSTINDVAKKNERIWAYIVDNDGYANSDKRFPTLLTDKEGAWLHNELHEYVDINGVKQSSKIEQAYEANKEDCEMLYKNEWNKEIVGKKCGFIGIQSILEKKTSKYNTITAATVNSRIKNEANSNVILSHEGHDALINNIPRNKKGYFVKKEHYIENEKLKEEFVSIFDELQIEYDEENSKFYDTCSKETIYALPLIPEKYFRKNEIKAIEIDVLTDAVTAIENELTMLFGGGVHENK
jgi:type I restriction-modification system DNA methylase subunit